MNEVWDGYVRTQKPFEPFNEFRRIVPSIFVTLLFNKGRDYDDPEMIQVREAYKVFRVFKIFAPTFFGAKISRPQ